jgi:branched-subunit amino acid ABC-type transport system permease component
MLGAYFSYTVVTALSQSLPTFILALILATMATALFGVAFELTILRRIYASHHAFQLLITFSLVLVVGDAVKLIWGRDENTIPAPAGLDSFIRPLGVTFPVYRTFLIGVGFAVCSGLWWLLYRSRWGVLVRAATVDRDMLRALGTDVGRLFTAVFALGSGLAGLAGGLASPIMSIGPGLHAQVLIDAFVVVVIGGMGSFTGALVGALLIGQANAFGVLLFPQFAIVVPFIVLTAILILRPWGLMGRQE